jgi:hypothetical protein
MTCRVPLFSPSVIGLESAAAVVDEGLSGKSDL